MGTSMFMWAVAWPPNMLYRNEGNAEFVQVIAGVEDEGSPWPPSFRL